MSVTGGQIRGKYHQDTNVPRSNPAISQLHKNIKRRTAHTIVSWPNPKQWITVHTSDLMMIIRQSNIFSQPSRGNWVNVYRYVCTMMIMRWCNVQTNEYDLKAITYSIICTHHKLHNKDENKIPWCRKYILIRVSFWGKITINQYHFINPCRINNKCEHRLL